MASGDPRNLSWQNDPIKQCCTSSNQIIKSDGSREKPSDTCSGDTAENGGGDVINKRTVSDSESVGDNKRLKQDDLQVDT